MLQPSDAKLNRIREIHTEHARRAAMQTTIAKLVDKAEADANEAVSRCISEPSAGAFQSAVAAEQAVQAAKRAGASIGHGLACATGAILETTETREALVAAFQVLSGRMAKKISELQTKHGKDLAEAGIEDADGQELASSGPLRKLVEKHRRLNEAISFISSQIESGGNPGTNPWQTYQEFVSDIVD